LTRNIGTEACADRNAEIMIRASAAPQSAGIFGLCAIAALAVGCHSGTALPPQSLESPGGKLFNGYTKPDVKCFSCHNGDGSGANGPNLGERVPKLTDDGILKAIDEGPSYMPSFKDKLTEQEKRDIIAWLRERFPAAK
jgi:mono/diheme cytochrome c family protein